MQMDVKQIKRIYIYDIKFHFSKLRKKKKKRSELFLISGSKDHVDIQNLPVELLKI